LSNLENEVFGKKLDQDAADHSEVTTRVSQALNSNYTNDENSDDNERTRRF
ncbi:MAG: cell division regulator GpsB, partial [Enterococcus sp.]